MPLQLKKPLVFLDLETTGVDILKDRIVEISVLKIKPEDTGIPKPYTRRLNPGIPIPPDATAVHGITNEDVALCHTFKQIAAGLHDYLKGCDIGGYNCVRFDVPLLVEEFLRAGIKWDYKEANVIDPMIIYMKHEERNLSAAYKFFCDKDLENAHSAEADTIAVAEVFMAQMARYNDIGSDIAQVAEYCGTSNMVDAAGKLQYDAEGDIVFAFGKEINQKVKNKLDYAAWMLKSEFPNDTKEHLRKIIERI